MSNKINRFIQTLCLVCFMVSIINCISNNNFNDVLIQNSKKSSLENNRSNEYEISKSLLNKTRPNSNSNKIRFLASNTSNNQGITTCSKSVSYSRIIGVSIVCSFICLCCIAFMAVYISINVLKLYKRNPEDNRNRVADESSDRIQVIPVYPFEPVDPVGVVRMGVPNRNPETALQLFNTMEERMYSIAFNRWDQHECCICMENFNNRQIAIVSKCRHIYHPDCIKGYISCIFQYCINFPIFKMFDPILVLTLICTHAVFLIFILHHKLFHRSKRTFTVHVFYRL